MESKDAIASGKGQTSLFPVDIDILIGTMEVEILSGKLLKSIAVIGKPLDLSVHIGYLLSVAPYLSILSAEFYLCPDPTYCILFPKKAN